jgi:molybdopterin synthase catalytic subunit
MANYDSDVAVVGGTLDVAAAGSPSGAGAIVQFFGDVRPLENGEPIDGIEYEAHQQMAEHQLQKIADEAAERFGLLAIRLHHRVGFVAVGETSLLLRVAAAHRGAAFDASRWIVDELKKRVPIWKSIRVGSDKTKKRAVLA